MTNMMSDDEILSAINEYPDPKYIWIDIWENDQYEIQLVLTINNEPMCHLGTHMVLRVSSLYTDEEETTAAIKTEDVISGSYLNRISNTALSTVTFAIDNRQIAYDRWQMAVMDIHYMCCYNIITFMYFMTYNV